MPKIINESCELVKLCDINCSGPVFLNTLYFISHNGTLAITQHCDHNVKTDKSICSKRR